MSKRRRTEPFKDVVARVNEEVPVRWAPMVSSTDYSRMREWDDEFGVRWRVRPRGPRVSRIEDLLQRSDVRVRQVVGARERDVPLAERGRLWDDMKPYLKGRGVDPNVEYEVGEYVNERGDIMLVIQGSC